MVVAQFTGVSLQNDYTSWEQYSTGSWGAVSNFTAYKNADPDDIRMKQGRLSFHVRAISVQSSSKSVSSLLAKACTTGPSPAAS